MIGLQLQLMKPKQRRGQETLERGEAGDSRLRIQDKYMKSSDAKASKCHLKFSSIMIIFIKLVCLSSVISLKLQ